MHGGGFFVESRHALRNSRALENSLVVEQVAFGGDGLVRLPNGKVCFLPRVIPGERVELRIGRERARYSEAELVRIVEPSPDRVEPPCPVFGRCGGCQYQHIAYPRQLELKAAQVVDVLRRLGGAQDIPIEPAVASPLPYHYRNRITVHVSNRRIGFYGPKSRQIVPVQSCPIASDTVNALLAELHKSRPRDGEYPLREPSEFRGFRQVNDAAGELLSEVALSMIQPGGGLLVDAYCGAGFFAKKFSHLFRAIIGIEWSEDAIRSARQSAGSSETYFMGDVKQHIGAVLSAAVPDETTVLLDPPAEGIDPEVLSLLVVRQPARIVYISCNPSTLARDYRALSHHYALKRVVPVDMFPQTAEIEVATLLERI